MTTMYDVTRYLIRNQGHSSGDVERDLLLTVDGAEAGYADLESYKEHVAQVEREARAADAQAAGTAPKPADTAAAMSDADLQAELDRRAALAKAQAGGGKGVERPGAPIPTS